MTGLSEGLSVRTSQVLTLALAVLAVAALFWFLQRTRAGKAMRAYSDNEDLALLSGVEPDRVVLTTWAIAASLAAIAGTLYGLDKSFQPFTYLQLLLPMFAAAIVGGIGQPMGAIAGGFLVAFSEIALTYPYRKFLRYVLPEDMQPDGLVQLLSDRLQALRLLRDPGGGPALATDRAVPGARPVSVNARAVIGFSVIAAALLAVGMGQSWSVSLAVFNLCLISAVMALGVNIQWGYAGLFNVGTMAFAALGRAGGGAGLATARARRGRGGRREAAGRGRRGGPCGGARLVSVSAIAARRTPHGRGCARRSGGIVHRRRLLRPGGGSHRSGRSGDQRLSRRARSSHYPVLGGGRPVRGRRGVGDRPRGARVAGGLFRDRDARHLRES